jgi:hypothetical protein
MKPFFISIIFSIFLVSCGFPPEYYPPNQPEDSSEMYSRVVNMTYDDTWSTLIRYIGSTFFSIDNLEKDSGVITLAFTASNAADFVNGGQIIVTGIGEFNGPYVQYLQRSWNGSLSARSNIIVERLSDNETRVTVNNRYVFTSPPHTWSFNSGGYDTQTVQQAGGSRAHRTMMPTYKAEQMVLSAFD